jgi:hypothetical protein
MRKGSIFGKGTFLYRISDDNQSLESSIFRERNSVVEGRQECQTFKGYLPPLFALASNLTEERICTNQERIAVSYWIHIALSLSLLYLISKPDLRRISGEGKLLDPRNTWTRDKLSRLVVFEAVMPIVA